MGCKNADGYHMINMVTTSQRVINLSVRCFLFADVTAPKERVILGCPKGISLKIVYKISLCLFRAGC